MIMFKSKALNVLVYTAGSILLVGLIFYVLFLNHVEINEVGIYYDSMSGQTWKQTTPGWYVTSPLTYEVNITTLPLLVTIPSNAKIINSKMVRFNPDGVEEFIRLQGFGWGLHSSLDNILLGYAFSGREYTFLDIVQTATPESATVRPVKGLK